MYTRNTCCEPPQLFGQVFLTRRVHELVYVCVHVLYNVYILCMHILYMAVHNVTLMYVPGS